MRPKTTTYCGHHLTIWTGVLCLHAWMHISPWAPFCEFSLLGSSNAVLLWGFAPCTADGDVLLQIPLLPKSVSVLSLSLCISSQWPFSSSQTLCAPPRFWELCKKITWVLVVCTEEISRGKVVKSIFLGILSQRRELKELPAKKRGK